MLRPYCHHLPRVLSGVSHPSSLLPRAHHPPTSPCKLPRVCRRRTAGTRTKQPLQTPTPASCKNRRRECRGRTGLWVKEGGHGEEATCNISEDAREHNHAAAAGKPAASCLNTLRLDLDGTPFCQVPTSCWHSDDFVAQCKLLKAANGGSMRNTAPKSKGCWHTNDFVAADLERPRVTRHVELFQLPLLIQLNFDLVCPRLAGLQLGRPPARLRFLGFSLCRRRGWGGSFACRATRFRIQGSGFRVQGLGFKGFAFAAACLSQQTEHVQGGKAREVGVECMHTQALSASTSRRSPQTSAQ